MPAEELELLNDHIVGAIEVLETFVGDRFVGKLDPATRLPVELA